MICVTLHNAEKPESSNAQVRLFARKMQDDKFQQIVYVKIKLEEFIFLLDVNNSAYCKSITNESRLNVLIKFIAKFYFLSTIFLFESFRVETLEKMETYFSS